MQFVVGNERVPHAPWHFSYFIPNVLLSAAENSPKWWIVHLSCRNGRGNCLLTSKTWLKPWSQIVYVVYLWGLFVSFLVQLWVVYALVQPCISPSSLSISDTQHGIPLEWLLKAPKTSRIIRIHQAWVELRVPVYVLKARFILQHLWSFLFYSTQSQENASWGQWNMP